MLKRIRGAIGMGLTWAAAWALVGIMIGITSLIFPNLPWWDSFFAAFDAPLPAMAVPGFFAGVLFSVVVGTAGRHRRFDQLSLPRFTAWGAGGGVLLALVPITMVALGLATPRPGLNMWWATAAIAPPLVLMSAASAAGTLLLARKLRARDAAVRASHVV